MKKYIAQTSISVSVVLRNGKSTRVSFSPLMSGESSFYTDDEELQWALERHYKFGKLFKLDPKSVVAPIVQIKRKPKKKDGKSGRDTAIKQSKENEVDKAQEAEEQSTEEDDEFSDEVENSIEIREVSVSDGDAAKDYLAEHFDIIRTKLKTKEAIDATAREHGIVFKYL